MRPRPDDEGLSRGGSVDPQAGPIRRCVLSGDRAPRHAMLRLVRSPDGDVVADLGARLPGRGAWMAPRRALIEGEVGRRALARALARAWQTSPPVVPPDFAERLAAGLERRFLDRLGLERRLGHLVFGAERLETLARSGQLALLVHAADAAPHGMARLDQALRAGGGGEVWRLPLGRDALSAAVGRANMVHLGISHAEAGRQAVRRLKREAFRWLSFSRPEAAPDSGPPADKGREPPATGLAGGQRAGAAERRVADEGRK